MPSTQAFGRIVGLHRRFRNHERSCRQVVEIRNSETHATHIVRAGTGVVHGVAEQAGKTRRQNCPNLSTRHQPNHGARGIP